DGDPSTVPFILPDALQISSASNFIITYLQSTGDIRIDRMFEKPETGHKGVPQGITATADEYGPAVVSNIGPGLLIGADQSAIIRSEEHTSELQSRENLVCR